jgi:hypothetical protein
MAKTVENPGQGGPRNQPIDLKLFDGQEGKQARRMVEAMIANPQFSRGNPFIITVPKDMQLHVAGELGKVFCHWTGHEPAISDFRDLVTAVKSGAYLIVNGMTQVDQVLTGFYPQSKEHTTDDVLDAMREMKIGYESTIGRGGTIRPARHVILTDVDISDNMFSLNQVKGDFGKYPFINYVHFGRIEEDELVLYGTEFKGGRG